MLDAPFFYANIEKVSSFLFSVFILGFVLQCFKANMFNLEKNLVSYPRFSYYLRSIGWIPYFNILSLIALFALFYVVTLIFLFIYGIIFLSRLVLSGHKLVCRDCIVQSVEFFPFLLISDSFQLSLIFFLHVQIHGMPLWLRYG